MSIFSKIIKSIVNTVEQQVKEELPKDGLPKENQHGGITVGGGKVENVVYDAPKSGFSWGPTMPAEENQFNYPGTYQEYFESVFKSNFPEYEIVRSDIERRPATSFTFYKGGEVKLVVEIMSENSSSHAISDNCRRNRIPYLRYYHNHYSWWNTKAYVIERTRNALNG